MYQEGQSDLKQYTNEDCGIFAKVVGVCGLWMIVTGTNDPSLLMDISLGSPQPVVCLRNNLASICTERF